VVDPDRAAARAAARPARSHRRLAVETAQRQTPADRRGAIMAALLDPLVDSIDTAAGLFGGPAP
jgi:hypothetical protein